MFYFWLNYSHYDLRNKKNKNERMSVRKTTNGKENNKQTAGENRTKDRI